MSCPACRQNPLHGAFARWKDAEVEIVGCREHVAEILAALTEIQAPTDPTWLRRTLDRVLDHLVEHQVAQPCPTCRAFLQGHGRAVRKPSPEGGR